MKSWAKAGAIGFIVVFIGLWIILLLTGSDEIGWKCSGFSNVVYCTFSQFIFSPLHIGFVLFFSWVGFFGGIINLRIIRKIINQERMASREKPLKITSSIVLSLIIVFAVIGLLAFENWVKIMIYAIIFGIFAVFISWLIGKKKFGN